MPDNIGSMAYYGDRPWHGLGTNIPDRANASQMICVAGLDWEVAMTPIPNVGAHADEKVRRLHLIRMPRNAGESEVPLGVVSSRYRALQNKEAFEFFDPIIGDRKAVFETAGSLGNGERIWVLAKVPGEIRVIGHDVCSKYLLLSNAHDGRGSVSVKFTPIRVVCQNTLMLALESGEKAHSIRHSRHMQDRLQNVQELLSLIWTTFQKAEEFFQALAKFGWTHNALTPTWTLSTRGLRNSAKRKNGQSDGITWLNYSMLGMLPAFGRTIPSGEHITR